MWVPPDYLTKDYLLGQDERIFAFETFRRWLQKSFFQKTGEYDGVTWLNRHMFAHGTHSDWQESGNFSRLVVSLATLALIESWYDETHVVSPFFPHMNEDSKLLWQQALLQANAQMSLKLIEERRYQKHGRLVPEMPTDDGVLLRKALLSEDCIKDLVRPLCEAGWSVEVGEPDERALFVTVVAKADGQQFGVALFIAARQTTASIAGSRIPQSRSCIADHRTSSSNTPTELMCMSGPSQDGCHRWPPVENLLCGPIQSGGASDDGSHGARVTCSPLGRSGGIAAGACFDSS